MPDWVSWKPLDFQANGASVFDAYYGEPENFCAGLGFRLLVDDPYGEMANSWQAGAGLGEPDADGYYGYGGETGIQKNEDGDWTCGGLATGGSAVALPLSGSGEEAPLSELVDAFFLTEGVSHDWLLPNYILGRPAEDMAALPALLDDLDRRRGPGAVRCPGPVPAGRRLLGLDAGDAGGGLGKLWGVSGCINLPTPV